MSDQLTVFRVLFDEDRTRLETDHDVMGWGVQFPSGEIVVDWNREAYPEEDRLEEPHLSYYGSLDDVEQGTGGNVSVRAVWPVERTMTLARGEGDGEAD